MSSAGDGPTAKRRVSIDDPNLEEVPEGHPEAELTPKPTPRGREPDPDPDSDHPELPAPYDNIFKSDLWPSLPIGVTSLESQITNVKLDLIMAYLQNVRLNLTT